MADALSILKAGSLLDAQGGSVKSETALNGKTVAIYFSAHWCPPCRAFTPSLVQFYNTLKAKHGDEFELVFCSSDRSKQDMEKYQQECKMPWLAVPHNDPRQGQLSSLFGIRGIPALCVVSSDGRLVTSYGRADVSKHTPEQCLAAWSKGEMLEKTEGGANLWMKIVFLFLAYQAYQYFFSS